jgi:hypothetical protein
MSHTHFRRERIELHRAEGGPNRKGPLQYKLVIEHVQELQPAVRVGSIAELLGPTSQSLCGLRRYPGSCDGDRWLRL